MKRICLFFALLGSACCVVAQDAPNYANSSLLPPTGSLAGKLGGSVNLFTGTPSVSVPIYSFKNNSGIGMSVSLEYAGGGIGVGESPSIVGLGWYLNAGGIITR